MATYGRSRTRKAVYFNSFGLVASHMQRVKGSRFPKASVVSADMHRVGISDDIAVEYDYGFPRFVDFLYHRRKGFGLVRAHYEHIKTIIGEISYIFYLLMVVVVGRADFHLHIIQKHHLAHQLVVEFHSPVVVAALRHADT